jgi:hypothetical protein
LYLSSMRRMSSLLPTPSCSALLTSSFLRTSPKPAASPVLQSAHCSRCGIIAGVYRPLLKQRILTWLLLPGRVKASSVGAKNMASSSGCAISSSMRLFCSEGKEALRVLVYIQKPSKTRGTEAHAIQFIVGSSCTSS